MVELLIGVGLAAFLFAALLWSIYRAVVTEGGIRTIAIFLSLTTIEGMLALTYGWVTLGKLAGVTLLVLGGLAIWSDPGWSKLLPLVQVLFGVVLILGLPWVGA